MPDIILIITGILCLIAGLAGCILPAIPGPPVSYAGLLLLHFTDKAQFSATQLLLWLLIVVIVQVLDYLVPMLGSKYSGGTRWGTRGCLIGTVRIGFTARLPVRHGGKMRLMRVLRMGVCIGVSPVIARASKRRIPPPPFTSLY